MQAHALIPILAAAPFLAPTHQDEAPQSEPWEIALEAIQGLRKAPFAFSGSVTREKPEDDFGLGNAIMIGSSGMGGSAADPFVGAFQGFRYSDEEVCVLSQDRFPGFSGWSGEQLIIQTLASKKAIDARGAVETMSMLLDLGQLARAVDDALWKGKPLADGKGWTLSADLPASFVEPPKPEVDGMIAMIGFPGPSDEPLRVETELTVGADGKLTGASFAVVHMDGNAMMQAMFAEAQGGELGGMIDINNMEDQDPIDGEVVTWNLSFGGEEPSKRVAAFRSLALEILETEDF